MKNHVVDQTNILEKWPSNEGSCIIWVNYAGVNIYPSAIENVVRSVKAFSSEFQIVVPKQGSSEKLTIKVEPASENVSPHGLGKAIQDIKETVKLNIGITPEIEISKIGSLPRYELKARRTIRKE